MVVLEGWTVSYERGTPVISNRAVVHILAMAQGDWYLIAERPAPAPHLAHP